jgi:rare lipoprotein A
MADVPHPFPHLPARVAPWQGARRRRADGKVRLTLTKAYDRTLPTRQETERVVMDRQMFTRSGRLAVILMAGASLAACATLTTPRYAAREGGHHATPDAVPGQRTYKTGEPYQVGGIWYVPHEQPHYDETGIASWYGDAFQMKATANGEIFDMNQFSAAHTTLPLPSMVEVTNLDNGRKLTVRVNDRGPFVGNRIIDLSHAAARELGYDRAGLAHVRVRYVGPAPLAGPEAGVRMASAGPLTPKYPIALQPPATTPTAPPVYAAAPQPPSDVQLASYKAPEPIETTSLAPLPAARPIAMPPPRADAIAAQTYRIQAGAFSDQDRARRVAAQLTSTGTATIEPVERNGTTLYRVLLPGPADELEAYAVRDKVAAAGFTDARVVKPF